MKKILLTAVGAALTIGIAGTALSEDFTQQIKARQAVMQVFAFNLGQLGGMAKGDLPYDADQAKVAADNLLAAVAMNNSAMWPQGSHQEAAGLAGKTRAKPEIWTNYPKVVEAHQALYAATAKMAQEAGSGLDSVRANIGAIGNGCQGCHELFRAEQ